MMTLSIMKFIIAIKLHCDPQHNDTRNNGNQHNDTLYNDTQNYDTQHNDSHPNDTQIAILSTKSFSAKTQ
jgi:hypothetical protein